MANRIYMDNEENPVEGVPETPAEEGTEATV